MKRIIMLMLMLSCICAPCRAEWIDLDSCVYVGCFSNNKPVTGKLRYISKETYYVPYSYYGESKEYYINPLKIKKDGNIVIAEIIEIWDAESLENAQETINEKALEKNENAVLHDILPITVYTVKYDMASRKNAVLKKVQMDEDFANETIKIDNTGEDVPLSLIHFETPSKAAVFYKLKEIVNK